MPGGPSAAPGRCYEEDPERTNREALRYLNRLSDLLFILARVANPDGDVLWQPGRRPLNAPGSRGPLAASEPCGADGSSQDTKPV